MAIKIGFVSLGCNKNLCDTENMMGILLEKGLLEIAEGRLRLTKRGTDCANIVFMEFLDD